MAGTIPVPTEKPAVAIDMDSTLAATMTAVFDELDIDRDYEDCESWNWPIEQYGEEFLDTIYRLWREKPRAIQPTEPNIAEEIDILRDVATVHIVTHQPSESPYITRGKAMWLDHHGIEVDALKALPHSTPKSEFDYDWFLDDKPTLPSKADTEAYLYDRPYNRDVDAPRVGTLEKFVDVVYANEEGGTHLGENDTGAFDSGDEAAAAIAQDVASLLTSSRDTHGDAVANQEHIAEGWQWYLDGQGKLTDDAEITGMDVGRMMPLVKMSRTAVGEFDVDHDRDVAGYAAIAAACAHERGLTTAEEMTEYLDE